MRLVSRFEANLLRVLQLFLRRVPLEQALPVITGTMTQPPCLSRTCVELVQDHLAKGCPLVLARSGGWRRERFQRSEQVVEGRLWDRTAPGELGLSFSKHTLRFLMWITAHYPADEKATKWSAHEDELTAGDWLLFYLAHTALRDTDALKHLRGRPGFVNNPLSRLAWPVDFADKQFTTVPDYAGWMTGPEACMLEALQPELAWTWVTAERSKGQNADWNHLRAEGQSQDRVLEAYLNAVETSGRRDLARFLLEAAARLLTPDATAQLWVNAPAIAGARLADRMETYRAALALVNRVECFRDWEQQARGVGYFDEGYGASQLMKAEWERWGGEELAARAQRIIRELDPLSLQTEGRS